MVGASHSCGAFLFVFLGKYLAMSKIERNVNGAYRVVKTFHNDQLYVDGTAINIKNDKLSAELKAKGLIEEREVNLPKPPRKTRGRKKKTDD